MRNFVVTMFVRMDVLSMSDWMYLVSMTGCVMYQ